MNCPTCTIPLQITERQGIEIDYCPQCRGIWLDRGELDKLIERSTAPNWGVQTQNPAPPATPTRPAQPQAQPQTYYGSYDSYGHHGHPGKRKKKSFLGEIFDF